MKRQIGFRTSESKDSRKQPSKEWHPLVKRAAELARAGDFDAAMALLINAVDVIAKKVE